MLKKSSAPCRIFRFKFNGTNYACDPKDLVRLGRAHDPKQTDERGALQHGIASVMGVSCCAGYSKSEKMACSAPKFGECRMSMRIIRAAICVGFFVLARTQVVGAQPFDFETTIRQPAVTAPVHEYPDILFQAGDRIFLDAGGCVQTGGAGKTWKRYVDPSGEAADRLYHGLVFIPGVTPGLVRIGGVINRPLDVPVGMGPWPTLNLTLGYEDSDGDYADNGYWGHDDGTEDQCKDVGAAWVTIRIKHAVNAQQGTANMTGVKDFDLKWDSSDPNGYPFNPRWYYASDNQTVIVDPAPHCTGSHGHNRAWIRAQTASA
jgi:hypothetical protein